MNSVIKLLAKKIAESAKEGRDELVFSYTKQLDAYVKLDFGTEEEQKEAREYAFKSGLIDTLFEHMNFE